MADDHSNNDRDHGGRFRAGASSPNPRGRPRKANDLDSAFKAALSEKVTVTENGKRKRKSKLDVTATQLANKGAGGDPRAIKMVFEQARKTEEREHAQVARAPVMSKSDLEIAALVIARITKIHDRGGSDASCA